MTDLIALVLAIFATALLVAPIVNFLIVSVINTYFNRREKLMLQQVAIMTAGNDITKLKKFVDDLNAIREGQKNG